LAATPNWILSLDGPLFNVPFAALRVPLPDGRTRFLIERNTLRSVPGIAMMAPAVARPTSGQFVGIGDPIYNTADSRLPRQAEQAPPSWFRLQAAEVTEPPLTRLPGTGQEVERCARAWTGAGKPVLLRGTGATRQAIERALSAHPAVLHFATHVYQPMAQRELAMIAIGLDMHGQPDFLTPNEIAAHRYQPGLVVLTGCSSGQGRAMPGVGLIGLTRAWLLSGAQSVVATHWPTPDESGEFFQKFYQSYPLQRGEISSASAAIALRSAQVAMLGSATWRDRPRYWAGFYVMGKD
jgi:CHAT domain-containing protein